MRNGLGWYSRLEMLVIVYSRIVYRTEWKRMQENEQRQIAEYERSER